MTAIRNGLMLTLLSIMALGCGAARKTVSAKDSPVQVYMDLNQTRDDRLRVEVDPGAFGSGPVRFYIPKTVPGTYSTDNYGRYVEAFSAQDSRGDALEVHRLGPNTWEIPDGKVLDRIVYEVNDTFDAEGGGEDAPFSPAGTNILEGRHYMLNLHGFVGYFEGMTEQPYTFFLKAPNGIYPSSSLPVGPVEDGWRTYKVGRYFDLIDNPIQFTPTAPAVFRVGGINVVLSVYSPGGKYSAADFKPSMEKMMRAQKAFLGDIDGTTEYNILLYLSTMQGDAMGFGALEHHTSTVVVLPEVLPLPQLEEAMTDVVSHEFFHIVTPLNVHSEEIQYFDYNAPKMSRHLWMYEGTTEYFANLFQVREGLIGPDEFYARLMGKIRNAAAYNDSLSFTEMSRKVLEEPYASQYPNVYEKGTLINLALDILLREQSGGQYGVLELMKDLSRKYDLDTPFKDSELLAEIAAMTYPEVATFFETHVIGGTPIDYAAVFRKVGLLSGERQVPSGYFLKDLASQEPFIDVDPDDTDRIFIRRGIPLNSFLTGLGARGGDVLKSINGTEVNLNGIRMIIGQSLGWTPDTDIRMEVDRDGERLLLEGKAGSPTVTDNRLAPDPDAPPEAVALRNAWLNGQ
ncbi:peptidase M61 [Robiginitalea sp. M366]|uniref:M61 family metallopeptidase n=1 Tax=Robiginitalea aestuariiviva TaxID=3036903 RepID=UPI00240E3D89|nr:peptidase M61 [Robiginitalea aestuariiviva]MDG1571049.1 peptidase M61 [Robiginitalea aestuariiviva]